MKKKTWVISAAICGMIISGSTGVYAGSKLQEIKAFLNHEIVVEVNNAAFNAVDAKGNKLAPITYNNTTYLPVRAISDALNVPIKFDAANNKVIIGQNGASTSPAPSSNNFERPKHLPSDFPLPTDAKRIELVEDAVGSNKSVYLTLQTKEDLQTWIAKYNEYFKKQDYDRIVDSSTDNTIEISATKTKESTYIEGKIIDAQKGIIEYTITWSAV